MITSEILKTIAPNTPKAKRDRFLPYLNKALPAYGINTELRISAFLATCAVESAWFKATEEYGKGKGRYYGKPDKVTGKIYYGRGIIQLTHKKNYQAFTDYVKKNWSDIYPRTVDIPSEIAFNADFVKRPELAAELFWAVESACWFWQANNLNKYADKGVTGFFATQGITNKGSATKRALGYAERLETYETLRRILPDNFTLKNSTAVQPQSEPPQIPADVPSGSQSESIDKPQEQPLNPPKPEQVTVPAKENSIATSTQMTIGGIVLPPALAIIVKSITDLIEKGFVSAQDIGTFVFDLVRNNLSYVFILIGLIIISLMLKKAYKQFTLWLEMYFKANPEYTNVEVKK